MNEDTKRCTGRTTNIILKTAKFAIDMAGIWVTCRDHDDKQWSHNHVAAKVSELLTVLGVEHEFNPHQGTVKVKPLQPWTGY